jgi:hypothetical protein
MSFLILLNIVCQTSNPCSFHDLSFLTIIESLEIPCIRRSHCKNSKYLKKYSELSNIKLSTISANLDLTLSLFLPFLN